ncbi:MAG: GNAT family N-acetyltransferase [Candidatus Dormibacteraeota bacterium]|nr:GNAT family N-acetyltransferase [Candidatus Dormibacteraeota bacterium]
MSARHRLCFVEVSIDDPLAAPLLGELAREYADRYGGAVGDHHSWLRDYPAAEFAAPDGGMLLGLLHGCPVTGGGFRRYDDVTAELKRIWTDSGHRRRGYATALLAALEDVIAARGYRRIWLVTGHRQPEAEALYESAGYARADDSDLIARGITYLRPFEKSLPEDARRQDAR